MRHFLSVAGLDPERTNFMLQMLHRAATRSGQAGTMSSSRRLERSNLECDKVTPSLVNIMEVLITALPDLRSTLDEKIELLRNLSNESTDLVAKVSSIETRKF